MVIKFGDIEFQVTLIGAPNKNPLDIPLRELLRGASISIFSPTLGALVAPVSSVPMPTLASATDPDDTADDVDDDEEDALSVRHPMRHAIPQKKADPLKDLVNLKRINFSNHTIVMVAKRLFKLKITGDTLQEHFEVLRNATFEWPRRSLSSESIWAVFVAPIQPPALGQRIVAVGINSDNQQVILGMTDKSEKELYEDLRKRGLQMGRVQFGMPSFHLGPPKIFRTYFPEAQLARDWEEFVDMTDDENDQQDIKALMVNPNKKEVIQGLKDFDGPKELLTYFEFPKELWRALRTANNINKIDLDLRSNTKDFQNKPADLEFITIWALLRIQYQWLRIPINGKQFNNLKYTQAMVQAIK